MLKPLLWTRRTHPAATPVRLKPSVDISFSALVYFGATLFIGVAAMNSQTNLLFGVFGLMLGVLFVAGYISQFSLKKLEIRRVLPDHLVVGQQATLVYAVANGKRFWPSISVALGEIDGCEAFTRQPYAYLLHVAAGLSTQIAVQFWPKRRGVHDLDAYQISTSFPFGFVKRAAKFRQKDNIVVLPALAGVAPQLLSWCLSAESSGSQMRPRRGGHDEFYGMREYRSGENPRMIHWKRSARTGTLVLREMSQVAPPRLMLLIDTMLDPRNGATPPEIERVIAMAASVASFALERGYPVGLCAWSQGWVRVAPSRGKRHRRELLSLLARLPVNRAAALAGGRNSVMSHLQSGTTLVVFTSHASSTNASMRQQGRMVTISSRDPAAQQHFSFAPTVNFQHCMPVDQEAPDFVHLSVVRGGAGHV